MKHVYAQYLFCLPLFFLCLLCSGLITYVDLITYQVYTVVKILYYTYC